MTMPSQPGAQIAGRLEVPVVADLRGFRDDLVDGVKKASKGVNAEVGVKLNAAGLRKRLQDAVDRASKGVNASVGVKLDAAGLRKRLQQQVDRAAVGVTATVGVKVDDKGLRARFEKAASEAAAGVSASVKVRVDTDDARTSLHDAFANERVRVRVDEASLRADVARALEGVGAGVGGGGASGGGASGRLPGRPPRTTTPAEGGGEGGAGFLGRLKARIAAAQAFAKANPVEVPVNVDPKSHFGSAPSMRRLLRGVAIGAVVSLLQPAIAAIGGLIVPLGALIGPLGQAVGSLGAFAPALAAAVTGIAAGVIGFNGMGDALGAMAEAADKAGKDAEQIAEDAENLRKVMAKLPEPMQAVAEELYAVGQAFKPVRRAVQEALFSKLAGHIEESLKRALPTLQKGLESAGAQVGLLIADLSHLAGSEKFLRPLGEFFNGLESILAPLRRAVTPLLSGIVLFLAAAAPAGARLAESFEKGARNFERMVSQGKDTGRIADFLDEAQDLASQLWRMTKNVASGLTGMFEAATPAGKTLLGSLDESLRRFDEWANSADGQASIKAYLDDMLPVFYEMVGLIGDVIQSLGRLARDPNVAKLVAQIRKDLVPALETFLDVLGKSLGPTVVDALTSIVTALSHLADAGGGIAIAVEAVDLFFDALNWLFDHPEAGPVLDELVKALGVLAGIALIRASIGAFAKVLGLGKGGLGASLVSLGSKGVAAGLGTLTSLFGLKMPSWAGGKGGAAAPGTDPTDPKAYSKGGLRVTWGPKPLPVFIVGGGGKGSPGVIPGGGDGTDGKPGAKPRKIPKTKAAIVTAALVGAGLLVKEAVTGGGGTAGGGKGTNVHNTYAPPTRYPGQTRDPSVAPQPKASKPKPSYLPQRYPGVQRTPAEAERAAAKSRAAAAKAKERTNGALTAIGGVAALGAALAASKVKPIAKGLNQLGNFGRSLPGGTTLGKTLGKGLQFLGGKGGIFGIGASLAAAPVARAITGDGKSTARRTAGGALKGAAAGAGAGALLGLVGGPLAPVTSTIGAAAGGIAGGIYGGISAGFPEVEKKVKGWAAGLGGIAAGAIGLAGSKTKPFKWIATHADDAVRAAGPVVKKIGPAIGEALSGAGRLAGSAINKVKTAVVDGLGPAVTGARTKAGEVVSRIREGLAPAAATARARFEEVRAATGAKLDEVKTAVLTRSREAAGRVREGLAAAGSNARARFEEVRAASSSKFEEVKSGVLTKARAAAGNVLTGLQAAPGHARTQFGKVKSEGERLVQGLVDRIGPIFSGIKEKFASPMRFVGNTVLGGLRTVFNKISGIVGGPQIGPISLGFAKGGVVPGYAPGRDTELAAVSPGEGWLVPEAVRGLARTMGTSAENAIQSINAAYSSRVRAPQHFSRGGVARGMQRFHVGGVAHNLDHARNAGSAALQGARGVLGKAGDGVRAVAGGIKDAVIGGLRKAFDSAISPITSRLAEAGSSPMAMLARGAGSTLIGSAGSFLTGRDRDAPSGSVNGVNGMGPRALAASAAVRRMFDFRGIIGGYSNRNIAGTNKLSKHALGKAIDVMTNSNLALGQRIADYFRQNRAQFGVDNVIFNRRIDSGGGWRPYGGQNPHTDHPHIDFLAKGGTVPARPGGTLAMLAEAGKAETVVDSGLMNRLMEQVLATGGASRGPQIVFEEGSVVAHNSVPERPSDTIQRSLSKVAAFGLHG